MITNGSGPRYAWYRRVSTEDEQDPTLSFPRQLANAERQVGEAGGRVVGHYFDVESGTGGYAARGSGGVEGFQISITRDGGLRELLAHAAARRFDRVIVESISRLSRNSSVAFRIEDELRAAGVRLCAADEPAEESFGSIVLRHVNIGIARGYHHELMVKSRQGQEVSTRQGWHTGGAILYGYRFVEHDHPNPHKAHRGQRKHTLELDPVRAPVVRVIYDWYRAGGVGLTQIRDRLNVDPVRFPPPTPVDPARAIGAWSRSSVWEVLNNPKYTGHQVWNRRARKKGSNRLNPPEAWIWSEQPAHPAIISRDEHDAVGVRANANARSRQGIPATVARPTAKHDYLYRGVLRCGICGLRMWGNHRRGSTYYSCQPSHQRAKQIPEGHPAHVYLNEAKLSAALLPFLGTALFGPDRQAYWRNCLDTSADEQHEDVASPVRQRELETGSPTSNAGSAGSCSTWKPTTSPRRYAVASPLESMSLKPRSASSASSSRRCATTPPRPPRRHPRSPTSPRRSTSYRSSPTGYPKRHSPNCARCWNPCNSTSPTSPPTRRSTSRSPSTTPAKTRRRTGPCPRQCPGSGHRNGVSRDIGIACRGSSEWPVARRLRHVETSSCRHCCARRPVAVRGRPYLRGLPGLGQPAHGPLPGRG
jgi:site-specific DNA recombinase